ncbi:MAG TPA: hypothetical protein VFX48_03980, partial [Saprospiraceae bacterium]|nr:hypothetical protein [Saprospiraceae bacterium]
MRIVPILLHFLLSGSLLHGQCPGFTETRTTPNCIPNCELCSGGRITINLRGGDLPHNGKVDFYADETPGFNPYNGQGVKIGSSNITTPNPKCRICPSTLGFMIDACGTEAKNEFIVVWTGSGLNTSDFNFDFATQNNTGGGGNADIGPGGCGITTGNPGLINGCTATAVGANFNLPPNAIWIVFTSQNASTSYDCSTVCGLTCKIFVSASTCDRTIGAFSNFDASPGNRTQVMTITGCSCSTTASYTIPGSLTGNGDFWAEGSIVNNGCATPSMSAPAYIPATSTIEPFNFTIPASWCDKTYEIVGIPDPKPEMTCCMEEFTERISVTVRCPKAFAATLESCETSNGQSLFNLQDADADVLGGSNGSVLYYRDMAGTMSIASPYLSGNGTIYAKIVDGICSSALVPVTLKVLLLPIAKPAALEFCDDGSGSATFDLSLAENTIKNGNASSTVRFYEDFNKTLPISSPYLSSTTVIFATIFNGECESAPVTVNLSVLPVPKADSAIAIACPEADGKAEFRLTDLIILISGGQSGVTVRFFEDDLGLRPITPPYRSSGDTLYAIVSNAKCNSETAKIYLQVSQLNSKSSLEARQCDPLFELKAQDSLFKQSDSSIVVQWFADSSLQTSLMRPVLISGRDTVYAQLKKDSCISRPIPVYLEAVSRPQAYATDLQVCSDTSGASWFDLSTIRDSINLGSGKHVVFSRDSSLSDTLNQLLYRSSGDTLYASVLDGSCSSLPVRILLRSVPAPYFYTPSDTVLCQSYSLPPLNGLRLSPNAAYYTGPNQQGMKLNPGDSLQSGLHRIFIYDERNSCIAQEQFTVDVRTGPKAGTDQQLSLCEGSPIDLRQYLNQADSGGVFIDRDGSGSLTGNIFQSAGHNGKAFRFDYILAGDAYCPGDTATIQIQVVQQVFAGLDTSHRVCEQDLVDLQSLLRKFDAGGLFYDPQNTGALSNNIWDSRISGPGSYTIQYQVGDGITCPKDLADIRLEVQAGIDIVDIGNQISCDSFILPAITGKNTAGRCGYYSQPNGMGSSFQPGDTIRNNMRIYVYGSESGYCSDEESFFIAIKFTPSYRNDYSLCEGDSIQINGEWFPSIPKVYWQRLPGAGSNGCDSLYGIVLIVNPSPDSIYQRTLCPGEFITVNNTRYDENRPNGTEILKGQSMYGCDSSVHIRLNFLPAISSDFQATLCPGEFVIVNGNRYDENKSVGTEIIKNASTNGCDSSVRVQLNFHRQAEFTYRGQICPEDSLRFGSVVVHQAQAVYIDTLKGMATNGCDSLVDIQVNFYPLAQGTMAMDLCAQDYLDINGQRYDQSRPTGTEILKNASQHGCDSVLDVRLQFIPSVYSQYRAALCENDSVRIHGKWYSKNQLNGIDTLFGGATGGCDSIVDIGFQLLPVVSQVLRDTLCPGASLIVNGRIYNAQYTSGREIFTNFFGCDSILDVNIEFSNLDIQYPRELILDPGQSKIIQLVPGFQPVQVQWTPSTGLSCSDCL